MTRLLWFFVGVLIAAFPMFAFADSYTANYYYRGFNGSFYGNFSTSLAACQDSLVASNAYFGSGAPYTNVRIVGSLGCYGKDKNNYDGQMFTVSQVAYCPWGGTLSGSTCINATACTAPQVRNATTGKCEDPPPPPCSAGVAGPSGYFDYGTNAGSGFTPVTCINGCTYTFDGDAPAARSLVGGVYHYYAHGSWTSSTFTCTGGQAPAGSPAIPPATCGTGQVMGEVNGQTVCVNSSDGTPSNPNAPTTSTTTEGTTTTTNPDGTTTTTTTTTTTNPDGSKTTTTKTCHGTDCTTTTTTTPGPGTDGSGGGTTNPTTDPTKPKDPPDLCTKYPNAAMCKERVKLDDEGISQTKDFQTERNALDAAFNESKTNISSGNWKVSDLGFIWNPQSQIPSGSCSSVLIAGQLIDVCEPLGKARELWGWCLYVLGALAIWITGTRRLVEV